MSGDARGSRSIFLPEALSPEVSLALPASARAPLKRCKGILPMHEQDAKGRCLRVEIVGGHFGPSRGHHGEFDQYEKLGSRWHLILYR
eukprot:2579915-Pyramimonas_sp.AAC.1